MGVLADYNKRWSDAKASFSEEQIVDFAETLLKYRRKNAPIVIIGNGGSMSTAEHFALDLSKATVRNHDDPHEHRFKIICPSTLSSLSAYSNDMSYESALAHLIKPHVQNVDSLEVAISASGNSPNILKALEVGRASGAYTYGLFGFDGGRGKDMVDKHITVKTRKGDYRVVEDLHLQICHMVIEYLENKLKA